MAVVQVGGRLIGYAVASAATAVGVPDAGPTTGTFLAGLAVNAAVKDKPARRKLEFMGNRGYQKVCVWVIT